MTVGPQAAADVVVIGAGIVGAATAWALTEAHLRVHVLEQGPVNRGGSGATAGNLHIQAVHSERPGQLAPLDAGRLLPLQRAASDRWQAVPGRLQSDIGLRRPGGFTVAETDEEVALLTAKRALEVQHGIPTEIVTGAELRRAAPEVSASVLAATWCALDGYANPLAVTPAFLAAAAARGARVDAFRPVVALVREPGGWRVDTPAGPVRAPVVINVAGSDAWRITRMAGVELAARPAHLQMHITTRTGLRLPHLIQHIGQGLSVKQLPTGQVLIGGGWPASERGTAEGRYRASMASVAGNLSLACRVIPAIADLDLLRVWTGPVLATADEMPVIGEVPGCPGLLVCGGTYAFTLAPLWAEVLSSMVLQKPAPVPVADLGPARLMTPPAHHAGARHPDDRA
jgi:sarcosine oxidase subunit beta